ncbi:membrane-associated protein, putative [Bodo saltans]|uniref:Membrane-associated protein, putative n=1 Tax=Bodo saltans TaxID=75058 RepID=A0A0S4JAA1_BODSA|nr:membrane-associated protein, putative [Bodo saltans]|eukprot:CUG87163.1 membrane-associated protein, putative [Bodo saltans]
MQGVDAFALILGLVMLIVLVFAGIGKYARRLNGTDNNNNGGNTEAMNKTAA